MQVGKRHLKFRTIGIIIFLITMNNTLSIKKKIVCYRLIST